MQNVVPEGASWDGKTDLPMDEATFKQMLSEIQPGTTPAGAPAAATTAAGTAAAAGAAPGKAPERVRMSALSEWLQLMLEEIGRKREAEARGRAEEVRRAAERAAAAAGQQPPPQTPAELE